MVRRAYKQQDGIHLIVDRADRRYKTGCGSFYSDIQALRAENEALKRESAALNAALKIALAGLRADSGEKKLTA